MTKLTTAVSQLKNAAKELLENVTVIDKQIHELALQRDALTSSNVSKQDFLAYLRAHFERVGSLYQRDILKGLKGRRNFALREFEVSNGNSFPGLRILTGESFSQSVTEEAFCFYFADIMIERLSVALDALDWDKNAVPIKMRRELLGKIEQESAALLKQRDELVSTLAEAGITGA